jgi:L-lactate dehydrogenase
LGEHGDSEVLAWSEVSIGGIPLDEFCTERAEAVDEATRQAIDDQVRRAAYHIIEGKGATYYGIGSALARIVNVILLDQRSILTVCTPSDEVVGVADVTVSLPNLVGGKGVLSTCLFDLSDDEYNSLKASARIVRDAIDTLPGG